MTHLRAPRYGGHAHLPESRDDGQGQWLLATGDFTTLGGMDRANYALAQHLAARGDTVHLVAHRVAGELADRRGIVVHRVPRPLGAHLFGAPLLARAAIRRRRALPAGALALMNGGNGVDGVPTWVHYLHAAVAREPPASLRARVSASAGRRYYLAREAAALHAAPLVICNSRVTAADVQRHYGVPASKTRVIYYGIDPSAFGPPCEAERLAARAVLGIAADRAVAIFVGALGDRRKGFDLLFDAWRSLSGGGWDADLIVAGAGAEQAAWASRARDAGLANVMMLGFRTDVAALLAAADVVVHPARYEAYGLGVHEAICRGVPAIVSATAGVAERFPPDLAPLVLPSGARADDVAAALLRWKQDVAGWRARVDRLSASFRARTWDHMAADIAAAIEAAA